MNHTAQATSDAPLRKPHALAEGAKVHVVANPRSAGGTTSRRWDKLLATLNRAITPVTGSPVEVSMTSGPWDAAKLTATALKGGADQIIAVGGDGTIHECINGFFENGRLINEDAVLAIMPAGTGGDYRRTFGLPDDMEQAADICARGDARSVDLGRISYVADDGSKETRYFNNIASFGLSGVVDRAVNKASWPKLLGGKFTFAWCSFWAALRYTPEPIRVKMDERYDEVFNVGTGAVAIGQYFGGGMHMAPMAEPDDGVFDVIIMTDTTLKDLMGGDGDIYKGTHIQSPKVIATRTRSLLALPVNEGSQILLDIDGESPGRLPASFEIVPKAIRLRT
jgi:YegS/Rv2252/BmrU family lipid kinase